MNAAQDILTILFAGGGTGGHLFPNIAVAERVTDLAGGRVNCHFAVSDRAIDAEIMGKTRWGWTALPVKPLYARRPLTLPGFALNYLRAKGQTAELVKGHNVAAVVASGGFVSGPVMVKAKRLGLSCYLLNLDAVPGKANRWLWPRADRVFSVCEQKGLPLIEIVDMPLRQAAQAPGLRGGGDVPDPAAAREQLGLDPEKPTLLVTGASQGATSINRFMKALLKLPTLRSTLATWQVLHLCGRGGGEGLVEAYAEAGLDGKVIEFLDEMGLGWGAATLVISRSGAGSVAEIRFNRVPAVFFPYPFHTDRHQWHNAKPLVDAGGAIVLEDHVEASENVDAHADLLIDLLADAGRLAGMRTALDELDAENGADVIARTVLEGLRVKPQKSGPAIPSSGGMPG